MEGNNISEETGITVTSRSILEKKYRLNRTNNVPKNRFRALKTRWKWTQAHYRRIRHAIAVRFLNLRVVVWLDKKYPAWEIWVVLAIVVAALALLVNVVFLAIAARRHTWNANGLGTLLEGDCKKVDWANKIAHGGINIISTILIAQSNYCMQLLASPTRHDVDRAHRRRQWVDIGLPSFRNVWQRHVTWKRAACWAILSISTAPLHLLWNSVIIFTPHAYRYNALFVTHGFVNDLPFAPSMVTLWDSDEGETARWPDNFRFLQSSLHTYENLTVDDCKRVYAKHFVQNRGDVILVITPSAPDSANSTILGAAAGGWGLWPYQWMCPPGYRQNFECFGKLTGERDRWTLLEMGTLKRPQVEYCLSKKMPQECKLEYGFWITILTISANLFKLLCFVGTYVMLKRRVNKDGASNETGRWKHQPLITNGDAIASFLEHPDDTTLGMSIVEKEDFRNGIWTQRWAKIHPIPWQERSPCRLFRAIGLWRWVTGTALLSLMPLIPLIFLLKNAHWFRNGLSLNAAEIYRLGMGNPSALFLFGVWAGAQRARDPKMERPPTTGKILENVALANLPQLALSIAYYIWNAHLTTMVAAQEYDLYAAPGDTETSSEEGQGDVASSSKAKRKPPLSLRVTYPKEGSRQRSTRFLTLPFRYFIPNALLWVALHWLASQAIFFARVDALDHWLEITPVSISHVGYSVLGIICFLAVATLTVLYALYVGLRKLENRMPLAATCSAALSAACHPRDGGLKHQDGLVSWGEEVGGGGEEVGGGNGVGPGRCTFTSLEARYPEVNRFYA